MLKSILTAATLAALVAAPAHAYVIDTSLMDDKPELASTWDQSTDTLGNVLSGIDEEVDGAEATATLVDTETWSGWGATSIILEEIAGYRDYNTFGWYDLNDSQSLNEIFSGTDNKNTDAVTINFTEETDFGFYMGSRYDGTFYTETALNGGEQQALIFQIEELANTYLIAWEDLALSGSDADYQDMIVRVQIDVPEPATFGLFAIGGLCLFLARRQQAQRNRAA